MQNNIKLKDNPNIKLPPLRAGSFGPMDRHYLPWSNLVLKEVRQRNDNGNIEIITQSKDGPEEKSGWIKFSDDDREKRDELFDWLLKQRGQDIETVYNSVYKLNLGQK